MMNIQQLYTNCLAQGAYYISNNGEAAIIDPLRETGPYLDMLRQNNDKLKYIFETHFHADFVSGHVDLAKETGAQIVFGPGASTGYKSHYAADGEEFSIGKLTVKTLHTPGHTLESTTWLLLGPDRKPLCIFTGDTLFIGDVGRPDLAIKSDLTQEDLAGMLYDSLRNKIMPLPDDVIVYPAHGAGSACGKNMSRETVDTLGNQKKTNYALSNMSREEFIKELTTGITPAPQYFAKNAALNKQGYDSFSDVIRRGSRELTPQEFETLAKDAKTLILDVRQPHEFAAGHIPGSLFIGLDGQFAPWVGTLVIDLHTPILLVAPEGAETEALTRLSRVGYDNCLGYLKGGIEAWETSGRNTLKAKSVSADELMDRYKGSAKIIDVRKSSEYEAAHLKRAEHKPLDFISEWIDGLDKSAPYMIHCAGGYRSMIALSIMERNGFKNLTDVSGGFSAIRNSKKAAAEIVSHELKA